ncbi:MAG: oligoendopeptidase F [Oscillospiraceae bacterium]|nr:oligoendopeptidase F [Oscillospiraceae bacterium]
MADRIPERAELDPKYTWHLEDLYPSDEAWQADLKRYQELIPQAGAYAGKLGSSAQTLYDYLSCSEQANMLLENLMHYAEHKGNQDTRVAEYQNMNGQMMSAYVAFASATAFDTPEILAISDDEMEAFLAEKPELERYRRLLRDMRRRKKHILSDSEEKILSAAGEMAQSPYNIYSMFADADIKFPDAVGADGEAHPLSQGTFVSCEESEDRTLRKDAYEKLYSVFGEHRNTVAASLNAQGKALQFFANARKYDSALHAALDENNVPVEVYRNLIEAVHQNLDKMHRYVRLRKKMLGVDELHFYDVYAPLVAGSSRKIPYEEACDTVVKAMAPLGEEYQQLLRKGMDEGWIDVYQNVGKRSGAYSAGAHVHPFVLLNYTGTLDSQFTLAHEMGHALHSYHSNRTQSFVDSDYVIFVAEVASTCNEALLMEYLLERTSDRRERAALINHFLEQFKGTLYRQTMFAEFELKCGELIGQGQTLTADTLCSMYRELNEQYFGPDMIVDDQIALEWARIPHFYMNYYVFQYATGYAAAIALSRRILQGGEQERQDYLNFLSGGCSMDPISLLKGAGVDMSTTEPVTEALKLFDTLLDEMESLIG